jgi:hypothetical protein
MNVETLAASYIAVWNETDPARRRALVEKTFSSSVSYVDPVMAGDGHDGIDALIAGVHQRFPGFRFSLLSGANGYGDHIRFSWQLGPDGVEAPIQGSDVAVIEDGRFARIIGFLDRVPA